MTEENKGTLEGLNKKVDAVIDHTASNFGQLETRIKEQGHGAELTHNKIELLENRFAGVEKVLADQRVVVDDICAELEDNNPVTQDRSAIYTALAAAQSEIQNATVNTDNDFTKKKYADLASVLNAVRGPLAKNGIALFQITEDQSQSMLGIRTILAHESGQTIQDLITMAPPKLDPQGIGSCRTYMRRYAVLAVCGIAGAADDDAEGTIAKLDPSEVEKILYQADELFGEHTDDAIEMMLKNVFSGSDAKVIGDIPAGERDAALNYLANAKKARDTKLAAAKKKEEAARKKANAEKKE